MCTRGLCCRVAAPTVSGLNLGALAMVPESLWAFLEHLDLFVRPPPTPPPQLPSLMPELVKRLVRRKGQANSRLESDSMGTVEDL